MKNHHNSHLLYKIVSLFLFTAFVRNVNGQETPKLVIGIVVDQMRYDYVHRYWSKYGDNGLKKLVNEGFFCKNTHYNYIPTYTGPGHASIYTGTTPSSHGICANDWYDRISGSNVNCVSDDKHKAVGAEEGGHISPANMMASTIGDELNLATNFKSKIISIAIKDRGAVLPGGHMANAAYWFESKSGKWISSTYYMKGLPDWVNNFNAQNWPGQYLDVKWETLLPITEYQESMWDNNKYETPFTEQTKAAFPYDLPKLREKLGMGLIKYTPWGNTMTADLALKAMEAENLGKNGTTDMLLISFSSTDYIGHRFGPRSVEIEDTYLRLDKDLARIIAAAEAQVGKENVLIFLTADHGVVDVPALLKNHKLPAGYYRSSDIKDSVNALLLKVFKVDSLVKKVMNDQVYFDQQKLKGARVNMAKLSRVTSIYLSRRPFITFASATAELERTNADDALTLKLKNGIFQGRSGDVVFATKPGWIESWTEQGTTHGTGYNYDTHVPLIWYGGKINAGSTIKKVDITDVTPTLSVLLNLTMPDMASGKPIPLIAD